MRSRWLPLLLARDPEGAGLPQRRGPRRRRLRGLEGEGALRRGGAPEDPGAPPEQLKSGGRLVAPVGEHPDRQELVRVTKSGDGSFRREPILPVRFVPMTGEAQRRK